MNTPPTAETPSLLDSTALPILELAELARRESHRPRPVYLAHKWFARRFGTAMRALLVGSQTRTERDFWEAFESGASLTGLTVLDPFVGGGTSLYEASRLGANVIGSDIDPVACAVTEFELTAQDCPDPWDVYADIAEQLVPQQSLYATVGPEGDPRTGLHYFWVQRISCGLCSASYDAHPNFRIAVDGDAQIAICRECGEIHRLGKEVTKLACQCGADTVIAEGHVRRGVASCPQCSHSEALIQHSRRTGARPKFELFAVESIPAGQTSHRAVPIRERLIHRPSELDFANLDQAQRDLVRESDRLPSRSIPRAGRSDDRLTSYGYSNYTELFTDRQLLHANRLLTAISSLSSEHQRSYALAFSNHLTSNCLLTRYTERWRQVTPLFSLRAFAHSCRPVELNPWLRGTGRGTFPNALRKVANAIAFAKNPREYTSTGFIDSPLPSNKRTARVLNDDSRNLSQIPDASVDIVLTDPPYLDNIDYSELADFFIPWLAAAGAIVDPGGPSPASLAAKGRGSEHQPQFSEGLQDCFAEAARVLKPGGRLVFTFQHAAPSAWIALGTALRGSGLHPVSVFPLRGDSDMSLHRRDGSTVWDAVFVLSKQNESPTRTLASRPRDVVHAAQDMAREWAVKLSLKGPDVANLRRALLVAAFLDNDEDAGDAPVTLESALTPVS
ncbi:hypothetical protein Q9S78_02090 [Microbacterium sp. KSW-18]|uniref:DNA methylase n=1 Tax=Microbacterium aquilitoris TaxID=3067307 RepID=A0ABU3GGB6_9MICO|nr:hypothetical protein [Microbacterium sp. KSW-18]MDT3329449.1 hypothetical protein [Microbacterium sp. KSW-18]